MTASIHSADGVYRMQAPLCALLHLVVTLLRSSTSPLPLALADLGFLSNNTADETYLRRNYSRGENLSRDYSGLCADEDILEDARSGARRFRRRSSVYFLPGFRSPSYSCIPWTTHCTLGTYIVRRNEFHVDGHSPRGRGLI